MSGVQIDQLIQLLAKLPGLGPRSARRAVLHLIDRKESLLRPLAEAIWTSFNRVPYAGMNAVNLASSVLLRASLIYGRLSGPGCFADSTTS